MFFLPTLHAQPKQQTTKQLKNKKQRRPDKGQYTAYVVKDAPAGSKVNGSMNDIATSASRQGLLRKYLTGYQADINNAGSQGILCNIAVPSTSVKRYWGAKGVSGAKGRKPAAYAVMEKNEVPSGGCSVSSFVVFCVFIVFFELSVCLGVGSKKTKETTQPPKKPTKNKQTKGAPCIWQPNASNLAIEDVHFVIERALFAAWLADVKKIVSQDLTSASAVGQQGLCLPPGYFWFRFGRTTDDYLSM